MTGHRGKGGSGGEEERRTAKPQPQEVDLRTIINRSRGERSAAKIRYGGGGVRGRERGREGGVHCTILPVLP